VVAVAARGFLFFGSQREPDSPRSLWGLLGHHRRAGRFGLHEDRRARPLFGRDFVQAWMPSAHHRHLSFAEIRSRSRHGAACCPVLEGVGCSLSSGEEIATSETS
jgi:hypothetical protein